MALWQQVLVVGGVAGLTWLVGTIVPLFALPIGQLSLVLLWALAPWWAIVPVIAWVELLGAMTFGSSHWPYAVALLVCSGLGVLLGPWWRDGTTLLRAILAMPLFLLLPWALLKALLLASNMPATHLPWYPPGLVSMALIWLAVVFVRRYEPRRKPYRLGSI